MTTLTDTLTAYGFIKDGFTWELDGRVNIITLKVVGVETYLYVIDKEIEDLEHGEWIPTNEILRVLQMYLTNPQ